MRAALNFNFSSLVDYKNMMETGSADDFDVSLL